MDTSELRRIQKEVEKIVMDCGKYALSRQDNVVGLPKGSEGDVVTDVDRTIEKKISEKLKEIIKDSKVVGEEYGGDYGKEYVWLIDPIDGTKNYSHHMSPYYVQVCLLQNNEPVLGVIYDPVAKQLFSASKGNGTYLNNKRVRCNSNIGIEKSIIDIDFGGVLELEWKIKVFGAIAADCYRVRISGARFALYLITGGINAFVVINQSTKIQDQMPRIMLFREAGFDIKEINEKGHNVLIMSEPQLTEKLYNLITLN